MTDAITGALSDLDTAITSIDGELSTVVNMVQQLQQELAAGNTGDAASIASQIEQRATTLQQAVAAAQSTLSGASSNPPTSGDTSSAPTSTDSSTSSAPPAAPDSTAPTSADSSSSDTPSTGSAMG